MRKLHEQVPGRLRVLATRSARPLAAALLLLALSAAPAVADAGELTAVSPAEGATVELDKRDEGGAVAGTLGGPLRLVLNSTQEVPSVAVTAVLAAEGDTHDGACADGEKVVARLRDAPVLLPANTPVPVTVDLSLPKECAGRDGVLVVSGAGDKPVSVRFALSRGVEREPEYTAALWTALGLTVAAFRWMTLPFRREETHWGRVEPPIEAPWSLKDSWLTNVTALGALLGTVLGAGGLLDEWLPGISPTRFLQLNVLFGGVILFAPVVYAASCSWGRADIRVRRTVRDTLLWAQRDKSPKPPPPESPKFTAMGCGWGLVASTCTTLFGVFGQLATLTVMTVAAAATTWPKIALVSGLGVAAATVFVYAVRFVYGALAEGFEDEPPPRARDARPPERDGAPAFQPRRIPRTGTAAAL